MAAAASPEASLQEVLPGLWIGDYQAAQDAALLQRSEIACVVSGMRQEYAAHPGMRMHRVAVDDDDKTNIVEHFAPTADFIDEALTQGQGVLVHCHAGVSRSTTLVAAYLMAKKGLNVEQAVAKIRAVRAQVEPSEAFMVQLEMFERCECEWDPVKWPEQRRFLMSFAQAQVMGGASPSIVLAYYPSPTSTPTSPNSAQQISPLPSPIAPTTSCPSSSSTAPYVLDSLPGLTAPPMRKRLTAKNTDEDQKDALDEVEKPTVEKIGSKEKVVVTGRRIRCKMCRRELAAREHIVAHEVGKGQQAFAPGRRDMAAYRAEQHKRSLDEAQKAASPSPTPSHAGPSPAPAAASPQPPTNPLAALRISKPLPGLRVATPHGPSVARPQPVARPTRPAVAPEKVMTRHEVLTAPPPSSAASASVETPQAASPSSSPSPPPTAVVDPPLLPSHTCSSYFVEPLSWMGPVLETGVLQGKIVCPNQKCGAKLGNFDWAGNQCSCGAWVCPGFALSASRVDEFTA
ncbi:hypothetical protein JCM10213_000549 [Rhodosporidiobolus nylandii]